MNQYGHNQNVLQSHPITMLGRPITTQPTPLADINWIPDADPVLNCPPGLEYLSQTDEVFIQQQIELMEVIGSVALPNKYRVKNKLGQDIYFATEGASGIGQWNALRAFKMMLVDSKGREVIHLDRPRNCDSCCCPCCLQTIEVSSQGQLLGHVIQNWSCFASFDIQNADGQSLYEINGPFCVSYGYESIFHVEECGRKIGQLRRKLPGFAVASITVADYYGITYPIDLDVRTKALMIGAGILIDYMYFQWRNRPRRRHD